MHRFKLGEIVSLSTRTINRVASGSYKIVGHLPEEKGEAQYRLESISGFPQRIAWESDIQVVAPNRERPGG